MRYRLRTLLILLAVGPPVLGWILGARYDEDLAVVERRGLVLAVIWAIAVVVLVLWDWRAQSRLPSG
jgi:hypothetical protein